MSHLKIQQLTLGYKPDRVLAKDINLIIEEGRFIGLVGQNGVGKSTFIRTICGIQEKLGGNILLDGLPIETLSPKEISKHISIVLTSRPDTQNLTVIEVIALGRYPYSGWLGTLRKQDKEKIEEAITQMEINYLCNKRLFELSDGQLQKVMIARALAQDTNLIILDEPTSHLDLKNKIDVLNLLKKITTTGKGVLISTHEIQLAESVCDEFWCMDFGKDMIKGKPAELIDNGTLQAYLHIPKEILSR